MSQAKVDRYKEEKRNRAKLEKKKKREWMLTKVGLSAVGLVMVGWIGYSVYGVVTTPTQTATEEEAAVDLETYDVNTSAIDTYMNSLES